MSLDPSRIRQISEKMCADYDAGRPNEAFVGKGKDWISIDEAYAVQRAVADIRWKRGEHSLGYKIGCVSPTIQKQFGLSEPVHGYIWESEMLTSPSHLSIKPPGTSGRHFVNLAVEGEIAVLTSRSIPPDATRETILHHVDCWFPVIELHNYVFQGLEPTSAELVASNGLHAGFVIPSMGHRDFSPLDQAEISVEINGQIVEKTLTSEVPGGPLNSIRWLASSLARTGERLEADQIVLTGSPGRLIPVPQPCSVVVTCKGWNAALEID